MTSGTCKAGVQKLSRCFFSVGLNVENELLERETGFEPATACLEGTALVEPCFSLFLNLRSLEKTASF
jgi:hypothetical protein